MLSGYLGQGLWESADSLWANYDTAARQRMYQTCELVFACVQKLITSASQPPIQLVRPTPDGDQVVTSHYVLDLLRRPNPSYSWDDFLQNWLLRWFLTGKSFVWKWRAVQGRIAELWPMPTTMCEVVVGGKKDEPLIKGYKLLQGGGQKLPIAAEDMFYIRFPHPDNVWDGLGPLQAAGRAYQLEDEQKNYLVEMLNNLRLPGMILKVPAGLTPDERADIEARIYDQAGKGRRGRALLVEGEGIDVEVLNLLKDLDWPGYSQMTESRLCMAFGVPPILVGARVGLERATYSNYQEAKKTFWEDTMVSGLEAVSDCLTRSLLYDEGIVDLLLRFDLSNVKPLQEDANKRTERAVGLFKGGLITRNEGRALAGEEPDAKRGDVYILPITVQEVPANAPIEELTPGPGGGSEGDEGKTRGGAAEAEKTEEAKVT